MVAAQGAPPPNNSMQSRWGCIAVNFVVTVFESDATRLQHVLMRWVAFARVWPSRPQMDADLQDPNLARENGSRIPDHLQWTTALFSTCQRDSKWNARPCYVPTSGTSHNTKLEATMRERRRPHCGTGRSQEVICDVPRSESNRLGTWTFLTPNAKSRTSEHFELRSSPPGPGVT